MDIRKTTFAAAAVATIKIAWHQVHQYAEDCEARSTTHVPVKPCVILYIIKKIVVEKFRVSFEYCARITGI